MPFVPPTPQAATQRLTRSAIGADGTVTPTASVLLRAAQAIMPSIDLETYSLARVIASEFGKGTHREQLAIAVADVRRARGAIFVHCVGKAGTYGRQGALRPVATSQDPTLAHAQIAAQAIAGEGAADFGNAIQYFDVVSQMAIWQRKTALHPLTVCERWHYNKQIIKRGTDADGRQLATLGPAQSGGVQWIGPRAGVRPERLMLFEAKTSDATRDNRYTAARAVIVNYLGGNAAYLPALLGLAFVAGVFAL